MEINVSKYIKENVKSYEGDGSFLKKPTKKTLNLIEIISKLQKEELKKGVLDVEVNAISGINNFDAGYISKEDEVIVGLQTNTPLKRIINPFGGKRMVDASLQAYNYEMNEDLKNPLWKYLKTHNDGVFDAYTKEMRLARKTGILTGLPDAYGRGRIIGDYRRVALYGVDALILEKKKDLENLNGRMDDFNIRHREEVNEQIRALIELKEMANTYGFDISNKANNAKEAVQWTYFAYLASVKENNGAAMSLGRVSTFLDIYIENDIENGILTEETAQELIDHLVLKLRLVRHLRTPEYEELFAGDPTWVTESIGGMTKEGKTLVTKTSYRFLHTLTNLNPSPEPNMTILWSEQLPENFKKFCAYISIETDSIQYENDDLMRPIYGDDYAIACCVSAMKIGTQMQFFGARANLGKALLYAINGGVDEIKGIKVIDGLEKIEGDDLNFDEFKPKFEIVLRKLAHLYADTMNIIHYMHDKYAYEKVQMALHDTFVEPIMAFGIAGLSVVADSLSAIKHAKVKMIRNEEGIVIDFEIEGDFPKYGNNDDRADAFAVYVSDLFTKYLKEIPLYKNAIHSMSILTITSNVVYGKKTGNTPDGRVKGDAFAPGANPMHGRDENGALASLSSVAKINYCDSCRDGVSNTFTIVPKALGKEENVRIENLVNILDGYFNLGGHHLNVNVLNKELLIDAMENPEKYPTLTIRVSGYAVNFNRLTREQQQEVISRTFHNAC
ncbi:MAG: formate C-acetyltransferase [Bacilli bacterium]